MTQLNLSRAQWRKSTRSSGDGQCVEVAVRLPDIVVVRDSKDPHGAKLVFSRHEWTVFIRNLKDQQRVP